MTPATNPPSALVRRRRATTPTAAITTGFAPEFALSEDVVADAVSITATRVAASAWAMLVWSLATGWLSGMEVLSLAQGTIIAAARRGRETPVATGDLP